MACRNWRWLAGGCSFRRSMRHSAGCLQVEIAARDVMLSLDPPEGLSALNVLACQITESSRLAAPTRRRSM
jgi:ABC-type molybdate transport system ATPase subunit